MRMDNPEIPLVVGLDETFIKADILYEGICLLLRKNFFYIFFLPVWLLRGKDYLIIKIFSQVKINMETLPYNSDLLHFLQSKKNKGRLLILVTALPQKIADQVSETYTIFNEAFGSGEEILRGKNKSLLLISKFGKEGFDYAGHSVSDLEILSDARLFYLIDPSKNVLKKATKSGKLKYTWESRKSNPIKSFFKQLRVYQWVKNFLLFIPLLTSHSFESIIPLTETLLGFFSFSLMASAGYIINDSLDLESDRVHPRKRYRPLASGEIKIKSAAILSMLLFILASGIALLINPAFLIILLVYFFISILYSIYLKKIALYDIFILALLYSIRVVAGALIINVKLSFWLIAFSIFIFLSLAIVKRVSEIIQTINTSGVMNNSRGYLNTDLNFLQTMGIVSSFMSVIVFSLYIDSPEVSVLYSNPEFLWGIGLLLLFWVSRIWHKTLLGQMTDDPIVFAFKDKTSYIIFGVVLFTIFYAI